jgi:hypothetical protein
VDSQDASLDPDELVSCLLQEDLQVPVLCLTMGQTCPGVCLDQCTPISTKSELMGILYG